MTIGEMVAAGTVIVTFIVWLVRLEGRVDNNRAKNDLQNQNHEKDLSRVESELKELIKSSIRSDEKMTDALNKLSLNMERVMGRMESMNTQIVELKKEN